mmetsp:Transcript_11184/g.11211  ORF Transcript_11184/g.11211 Transcript_11184/m.11211 type:complete len:500 (+) Transcript_11184:165-1664(+)
MSRSSSETSSFVDESWISWFCSLAGNQFFCEIDKGYIDDAFNLFGLKQQFPKDYNKALDTILDRIGPAEAESEELSRSAALLFGLIHARYIVTSHGLEVMHRKYVLREFGECPRTLCRGQAALPMGFTDEPKHGAVKLFCPRCQDVYSCQSSQKHIDGAFFGPTFPNLFMMSFEELVPEPPVDRYVPRIFGFKIHSSSRSLPISKNKNPRVQYSTPSGGNAAGQDVAGPVESNMVCTQARETSSFLQPASHASHTSHNAHASHGSCHASSQNTQAHAYRVEYDDAHVGNQAIPQRISTTTLASHVPAPDGSAQTSRPITSTTVDAIGKRTNMFYTRQQAEMRYHERLTQQQHMHMHAQQQQQQLRQQFTRGPEEALRDEVRVTSERVEAAAGGAENNSTADRSGECAALNVSTGSTTTVIPTATEAGKKRVLNPGLTVLQTVQLVQHDNSSYIALPVTVAMPMNMDPSHQQGQIQGQPHPVAPPSPEQGQQAKRYKIGD